MPVHRVHSTLSSPWSSLPLCVPSLHAVYLTITWDGCSFKQSCSGHPYMSTLQQHSHPLDPLGRIAGTFKIQTPPKFHTALLPASPCPHTLLENGYSYVSHLLDIAISHTKRSNTYGLGPTDLIRACPSEHDHHAALWQRKMGEWKGVLYLHHTTTDYLCHEKTAHIIITRVKHTSPIKCLPCTQQLWAMPQPVVASLSNSLLHLESPMEILQPYGKVESITGHMKILDTRWERNGNYLV